VTCPRCLKVLANKEAMAHYHAENAKRKAERERMLAKYAEEQHA
jgi:hypothetical protein